MSWILGTSVPNRDRKESFRAEGESGNELGVGVEEMSGREKNGENEQEARGKRDSPTLGKRGAEKKIWEHREGSREDRRLDKRSTDAAGDGWRQREAGRAKRGAGPAKPVTGQGGGGGRRGARSEEPSGHRTAAGGARPGQDSAARSPPPGAPAGPAGPARTRSLMTVVCPNPLKAAVSWQRGARGDGAPQPEWQLTGLRGP